MRRRHLGTSWIVVALLASGCVDDETPGTEDGSSSTSGETSTTTSATTTTTTTTADTSGSSSVTSAGSTGGFDGVVPRVGRLLLDLGDSAGGCGHGPEIIRGVRILEATPQSIVVSPPFIEDLMVTCPFNSEFGGYECPTMPLPHPGIDDGTLPGGVTLSASTQIQFDTETSAIGQILYSTDCSGDCAGAPADLPCTVNVVFEAEHKEGDSATPVDCADLATLTSPATTDRMLAEFVNETGATIYGRWLTFDGELDERFPIEPDTLSGFVGFVGHIYAFEDEQGNCLQAEEFVEGWNVIRVGPN